MQKGSITEGFVRYLDLIFILLLVFVALIAFIILNSPKVTKIVREYGTESNREDRSELKQSETAEEVELLSAHIHRLEEEMLVLENYKAAVEREREKREAERIHAEKERAEEAKIKEEKQERLRKMKRVEFEETWKGLSDNFVLLTVRVQGDQIFTTFEVKKGKNFELMKEERFTKNTIDALIEYVVEIKQDHVLFIQYLLDKGTGVGFEFYHAVGDLLYSVVDTAPSWRKYNSLSPIDEDDELWWEELYGGSRYNLINQIPVDVGVN